MRLRLLFALLVIFSGLGCAHDRRVDAPVAGRPLGGAAPNIIYILADDLGYGDLGSYGQQVIQTPSLDAMAAKGLRFTDHYAGSTVCAPSRCVLMTGKHTGRCFIRGNYHGADGYTLAMPAGEPSLPRVLRSAGYATACIGKWGLGPPDSASSPNNFGFDFFYGFLDQRHAHNHYPDYLWRNDKRELTGNVMTEASRRGKLGAGVAVQRKAYANDLFFEESAKWIEQQAKTDEPFFLYLALTVPHTNNEAAGRLLEQMPEADRAQQGQEVPDLGPYADQDWPGPQKGTAAMITRMDRQVGALIKQLETLGVADNTLIVFTSDNGPHAEGGNSPSFFDSNGPLRGIKRDLYEGGIRVPMIAYWPGTVKPAVTGHISSFEDVLPTVAELAGTDTPAGTTGISFAPTLWGQENQGQHDYLYWAFYAQKQKGKQAVRLGKWKGVRLRVQSDADAPVELYDLSNDLGEQNNVADQHPGIVAQIKTMMGQAQVPAAFERWRFDWER